VLEYVPDDQDMIKQLGEIHVCRPGAIGDIIMTLHALEAYKRKYPGTKIIYYCAPQYKDVPLLSRAVSEVRDSKDFQGGVSFAGYPRNEGYPDKPMQKHLIQYFGKELGLDSVPVGFEPNLPSKLTQAEKYITIQPYTGWSQYKEWSTKKWEELIYKIKCIWQGPIYQISEPNEYLIPGASMLNVSLVTAIKHICYSNLHIGGDSFGNHATALLPNTPAVILWGSTSPIGSGYDRNTNIWPKKPCGPCYKERKSMSIDYRGECENPCINEITVDEVFAKVRERVRW
jgi:ADP-heptose:LPS heptosyltransferase